MKNSFFTGVGKYEVLAAGSAAKGDIAKELTAERSIC